MAAVLGVHILSERFTPAMAPGFGLVLAGSILATRPPTGHGTEPLPLPAAPAP